MSRHSYVIGLTGNIATGKSLVGRMLARCGAEHVDADHLAHHVMAQGTPAWERIVAVFGCEILRADGQIDRARLGARVFADAKSMAELERIVHPEVIDLTEKRIAASTAPAVVVEAIKLIESGMVVRLCDALWVVTAPRHVQIERLVAQRGLSQADAVLRIDAQPPQAAKVVRADVVIDNGGTVEETEQQIRQAWDKIGLTGGA